MVYRMTRHASQERIERIQFIMENVGFGEPLCETGARDGCTQLLTDTGVILILDPNRTIITAYIGTMARVTLIWRETHPKLNDCRMPNWFYYRIMANKKKFEAMQKLDYFYGYHSENKNYKFYN